MSKMNQLWPLKDLLLSYLWHVYPIYDLTAYHHSTIMLWAFTIPSQHRLSPYHHSTIMPQAFTIPSHYTFLPMALILTQILLLTGGNWQKWKRVFLTCPCHEIYRDEAVGLKSCKNTWKITTFVKMWNLGQYRENLIFCQ